MPAENPAAARRALQAASLRASGLPAGSATFAAFLAVRPGRRSSFAAADSSPRRMGRGHWRRSQPDPCHQVRLILCCLPLVRPPQAIEDLLVLRLSCLHLSARLLPGPLPVWLRGPLPATPYPVSNLVLLGRPVLQNVLVRVTDDWLAHGRAGRLLLGGVRCAPKLLRGSSGSLCCLLLRMSLLRLRSLPS